MNPYQHWIAEQIRLYRAAQAYPLGGFADCPHPEIAPDAPTALIFSPHPDDEVIIGGLALRLLRQARWRVVNVAVTQGSKKERQQARWEELRDCCRCIGFDLLATAPGGLECINAQTRRHDPAHWQQCVNVITGILRAQRPKVIFYPHEQDWNISHIGTHLLVTDSLRELPDLDCFCVETEFWGAMAAPNLMVEIAPPDLADLIAALTFHQGEVKRNPYHLTLPSWMADNVRRGGELVGGQGGAAPDYLYATLYRLRRWRKGTWETPWQNGRLLPATENPANLF